MREDQKSIFWITGKAGSGKSTLVKYITPQLQDEAVQQNKRTVASLFFHWSQDTAFTTARSFVQSFLFQILSQTPSTMSDFVPLLSQQRCFHTGLDHSGLACKPWIPKDINEIFAESLKMFSKKRPLWLFIDALDECHPENSSEILSLLSSISPIVLEGSVKLCITSRPHRHMEAIYRPWHQKIILENENTADIQRFVESHMQNFTRVSKRGNQELFRHNLVEKIVTRAEGVFLWVELVVVNFLGHNTMPVEILESTISNLPKGLD